MKLEFKLEGVLPSAISYFQGPVGEFGFGYFRGFSDPKVEAFFYGDSAGQMIVEIRKTATPSATKYDVVKAIGPVMEPDQPFGEAHWIRDSKQNVQWLLETKYLRSPYVERMASGDSVTVNFRGFE